MFAILAVSEGNRTPTRAKLLNKYQNTEGYKKYDVSIGKRIRQIIFNRVIYRGKECYRIIA